MRPTKKSSTWLDFSYSFARYLIQCIGYWKRPLSTSKFSSRSDVPQKMVAAQVRAPPLSLLRTAYSRVLTGEHPKRAKRIRLSSPATNAHSPSPAPASSASGASLPRITVRLPTRSAEREKAGVPLREGRRVAFHPPGPDVWILGLIKRHFMEGGRQMYVLLALDQSSSHSVLVGTKSKMQTPRSPDRTYQLTLHFNLLFNIYIF